MTQITENQWVNYFGFQRFPFDRPEAGNEEFARPEFLASCFVEPRGFERVFGQADSPVTSLLFAARGTGKTACRVMMEYYCQNGLARLSSPKSDEPNYVLSVPHIRLDNVLNIARQSTQRNSSPKISVELEHHSIEIMRQTIPAFVDLIAKNTALGKNVRNLSKAEFEDLSVYIIFYSTYLSSSQKEFLGDLGIKFPASDKAIKNLIDKKLPLFHLERWAKLMPRIGIKATYVLIDGVDELMESAGDSSYAHKLIRPLLTNLILMDQTRYLALKFFLPSDLEQIVLSDSAFRKDRGFVIQKLKWQEDDLVKILRERLNALRRPDYEIRDRTSAGFDTLCVPELRGQIEQDIIDLIKGNPRHLMNFCSSMVSSHCNRDDIQGQDDPYQLDREDFNTAKQVFDVKPVYQSDVFINQKPDITSLIAQGENESVEFKSSIRYDYKRQSVNKEELGLIIAKTVAGFMNRSGGTLLIGLDDNGQILGIEKDFETLSKKSTDGFQLVFKDIIKTYIGVEYLVNLHLYFEYLDGHIICAVLIEKSSTPTYIKNGENNSEFYIRTLNSTVKLGLPETVNYIRSQWG